MTHRSHIMLAGLALATAARFSPDADDATAGATAAAAAAQPVANPGVTEFEFPNLTGKRSFDVSTIPADTRLDLLKGSVRGYIANRLNGVHTRYEKDADLIAWKAYDAASTADPLQTAVAKPTVERPAAPDYEAAYTAALLALTTGAIRKAGAEPKARKTKDPLIATVTDIVVREVYASRKAADPKYNFLTAKKEVGSDGIAYLNGLIATKVAEGGVLADLEKMRDTRYINPAKIMLGITTSKATDALPSIL